MQVIRRKEDVANEFFLQNVFKLTKINALFCFFAGLFVGALIRYAASKTTTTHITVYPNTSTTYNQSLPPDTLWLTVIQYKYVFFSFASSIIVISMNDYVVFTFFFVLMYTVRILKALTYWPFAMTL